MPLQEARIHVKVKHVPHSSNLCCLEKLQTKSRFGPKEGAQMNHSQPVPRTGTAQACQHLSPAITFSGCQTKLMDLTFALLVFFFFFSHTSLIPPYSFPFSQFGRGVCTCACVLEACAMLFLVFHSFKNKGAQALRVGYVLLHVAGTVKGMGDSQTGFILQYVRDISIQEPGKDYLLFYMLNDFSELRCWSVSFQGSNVGSQQKDQEAGTHGGWGRVVNGACL